MLWGAYRNTSSPPGQRLPLVRDDFGEKWNGIMKMDTKIPGSQEPGSGLKYQKSTCCVPLVWQGATLKMAHFTRRQQPCQPCTQHIPSMSICTIKQEAKGFLQSKWGRPIEARPKSSVTVTTSLVKKQQIRTFEPCWQNSLKLLAWFSQLFSVSFLHSTIHEHHPGMLSPTLTRRIQGEKDSDQGQVSPSLLTPSHDWCELQVELPEGDGTPLP